MTGAPVASVIVPCRNAAATVGEAVEGALSSALRDLEVIAVDDASGDGTADVLAALARRDGRVRALSAGGRGVSAARNAGLDAARGRFLFFVDADDAVDPEVFPLAVSAMERDGADYCRFAHVEVRRGAGPAAAPDRRLVPVKTDFRARSQAEIRERLLPCFFGYSFDQVRAWYGGEPLWAKREMGGVYLGCYRASVLREGGVRFDERLSLFEDAMFLCEYLLACRRTTMLDPGRPFYEYRVSRSGAMLAQLRGEALFAGKLRLLAKRREIDARCGGALAGQYAASCVFSLIEMLAAALRQRGCLRRGLGAFFEYGRDPAVRAALRGFPLAWRKPVLAAAVLMCRIVTSAPRWHSQEAGEP